MGGGEKLIIGIGLDVIEVSRFGHGAHPRLEARILTPRERRNLSANGGRRSEYVAGRFAVKEAVAKAAGCGIGQLIGWQDIEVLPDDAGRPTVMLSADAVARLGWKDARIHVSITHSRNLVAAQVIVEHITTPD